MRLGETPAEITWRCPVCGEAGELRGWECSIHDLGGRLFPADGSDGARVEVEVSDEQYRFLERIDRIDLQAEQLVRSAMFEGGAIRLAGTREEFAALNAELTAAIRLPTDSGQRARLHELQRLLGR